MSRGAERNRALSIIKARGTDHSNQVREFVIRSAGLDLLDVHVGEGEVLMGTARSVAEAQELEDARLRAEQAQRAHHLSERRQAAVRAQIAALEAELAAERDALLREEGASARAELQREADSEALSLARHADEVPRDH